MNAENSTVKSIAVTEVLMHQHPHLDEIFALYILRMYGTNHFPGIDNAGVRYVTQDVIGTDDQFDREGKLPIGTGSYTGSVCRFNDHRSSVDNTAISDRQGMCATMLVANYLGITSRPELRRILQEIQDCDSTNTSSTTMLSELVKVGNRTNGGTTAKVVNWIFQCIYPVLQQEVNHYARIEGEKSLLEFFVMWKASVTNPDESILGRMSSLLGRSMSSENITELGSVVASMTRTGMKDEDVASWLFHIFSSMYSDQLGFKSEVERLKALDPITIKAWINGSRGDGELRLLVVTDSNHHSQKVARRLGNQIVLLVQRSGNFQIFTDSNIRGLSLRTAVSMIRYLALPTAAKRRPNWRELEVDGTHPDVPDIYYFAKGESIFNGSITHAARPLGLSVREIVDVLTHGFHITETQEWGRRNVR